MFIDKSRLVFLAAWTLVSVATAQKCWYPDGKTQAPDIPCKSGNEPSACCGADDFCMDNGLCLHLGVLSRGSCTDQTWGPFCPRYCRRGKLCRSRSVALLTCSCFAIDHTNGAQPLQPCDMLNAIFVCGTSNYDCVTGNRTFFVSGAKAIVLRPDQVESSPKYGLTILANSTLTPGNVGGFSTGQMAAVGAGVGLPLLILFLAAVIMLFKERSRAVRLPGQSFDRREAHAVARGDGRFAPARGMPHLAGGTELNEAPGNGWHASELDDKYSRHR